MPQHAPRGRIKGTDPMKADDPMHGRCKAHSRSGKRCGNAPILGAVVCRMHGGSAPQVREAAQARLDRLADGPALDCFEELVNPEMRKQFPSTALGAARYLVDRKHGTPTETVNQNITGDEALIAALLAGRKRAANARKAPPNDTSPQAGD